jgi:hypothetical protein
VAGTALTIPPPSDPEWTEHAVSATDEQSGEELEELRQEQEKTNLCIELLGSRGADAYQDGLEALGPNAREHWEYCLNHDPQDLCHYYIGRGQKFTASATDLLRFLTDYFLPV